MLNRELQLRLLHYFAARYPGAGDVYKMTDWVEPIDAIKFQIAYLVDHGLLSGRDATKHGTAERMLQYHTIRITARGLDHLEDDGGLSAILGVVTIKIHEDTLKELIQNRVLESALSPPEKKRLLEQIQELPAAATKHLALRLLDKAMDQTPAAMQWLETSLRTLV